jgi:hypothetical protein
MAIKALTTNIVFKEIDSNPNYNSEIGVNFIGLYSYLNQSVVMEVVDIPSENLLRLSTKYGREIYSKIEIEKGDKVIVDLDGINSSISEERTSDFGGFTYHSFPYDFVYAKIKDNGELQMLNGYILLKRLKQNVETKLDSDFKFYNVVSVSKPIQYHFILREAICMEVEVGQSVMLHKAKLAHLEHTINKVYSNSIDELFICDRASIMAILDEEKLKECLINN